MKCRRRRRREKHWWTNKAARVSMCVFFFFHSRLGLTANPHNTGRTSSNTSQVFFPSTPPSLISKSAPSFYGVLFFFFFFWKEAHTYVFTRDRLIKILRRTSFSRRPICVCKTIPGEFKCDSCAVKLDIIHAQRYTSSGD